MDIDYKKVAAVAAVAYIQPGMTVGFGAGSTMAHMINRLKEVPELVAEVAVVTSSYNTRQLLLEAGFRLQEPGMMAALDIYFDGCDQFDVSLNALKSGGGIHTKEKLLAAMATRFVLVADGSKYVERLYTTFPVVIEVIPEAVTFVLRRIRELFREVNPQLRLSNRRDGAVMTDNGNMLIDIWFTQFPELAEINPLLKGIPGVLETSLFYWMAHEAVIAGRNGVEVIYKKE
ncbi:ribose 5-phosphate isomerase A [Chitinophaga solisilvae]|uniref:ribose 5-phosphate isomerase A n=1 Tax=Chitinophaga solisilvae TaxID=1233460 RepID=UPI00136CED18|nr:ribose 5-phosphate isomerase A [Chitinophaga solisilvae]